MISMNISELKKAKMSELAALAKNKKIGLPRRMDDTAFGKAMVEEVKNLSYELWGEEIRCKHHLHYLGEDAVEKNPRVFMNDKDRIVYAELE